MVAAQGESEIVMESERLSLFFLKRFGFILIEFGHLAPHP
jgi:hypothetical protein